MVLKRERPEDVYGLVLQRLRDRVKARLLESQSPVVDRTPAGSTFETRRRRQVQIQLSSALRPGRRTMYNEYIQGDKWETYLALVLKAACLQLRFSMTKHGMAYRARALKAKAGSRSANSTRGGNGPPGSTGEPCTGESGTGSWMITSCEVRMMRIAKAEVIIVRALLGKDCWRAT